MRGVFTGGLVGHVWLSGTAAPSRFHPTSGRPLLLRPGSKPRLPTVSPGPNVESTQKPPQFLRRKNRQMEDLASLRHGLCSQFLQQQTRDAKWAGNRGVHGMGRRKADIMRFCPCRMFLIENFPVGRNEKPVFPLDWVGLAEPAGRGWGRLTLKIRNLQCVDSPRMTENKLAERERVLLWRQKTIICWIS